MPFSNPVLVNFRTVVPPAFQGLLQSDPSKACFAVIDYSLNQWTCRSDIKLIYSRGTPEGAPSGNTSSFSDYAVLIVSPESDEQKDGNDSGRNGVGWIPFVAAFAVAGFLIGVGIVAIVVYRYRVKREEEKDLMDKDEKATSISMDNSRKETI